MGLGRTILVTAFPVLATLASVLLILFLMLGCTSKVDALSSLYFLKVDFTHLDVGAVTGLNLPSSTLGSEILIAILGISNYYQAGMSGFCQGSSSGLSNCSTPVTPYWFDLQGYLNNTLAGGVSLLLPDKVQDEISEFRMGSQAAWVCFLVSACLAVVSLLTGMFAYTSRWGSFCSSLISFLSFALCLVGSALVQVIYPLYSKGFNDSFNKYGIQSSLRGKTFALSWLATAICFLSTILWFFSICCGSTSRRARYRDQTEYQQPQYAHT